MKLVILALAAGAAAAASDSHEEDAIIVGQTFLAGAIDPTGGSTAWSLTSHGIAEKLYTVDKDGEIVGQVAESVTRVASDEDGLTWDVTIKDDYKFTDGTPVTAEAVAAALNEMNEVNPSASASLGKFTATATSDTVVQIVSERPTHVMDAVLAEWVFTVYKKDADGNFVFTGPYAVETFAEQSHIDLVPNEYYPTAVDEHPLTIKQYADGHALAKALEAKEIDMAFHLPIDTVDGIKAMEGVDVKSFEVGYHYMMFHNMRAGPQANRQAMADKRVRQAIDLAIDRTALGAALQGAHGTRSLFPDFTPYYSDDSDPAADKAAAEALLDEAGWTMEDGKRSKDGQALTIKLVAYPHRPGLVIMQPVIKEQLEAIGIEVDSVLTSMNWDDTAKIINEKDFDLLMWAQNTLPAGDPAWFLNNFFRTGAGSNHAGLESADVDALLDNLGLQEDHGMRVSATAETQEAILADVPVSNLVTPMWHVGLSDRLQAYEPWGSDYYVIRADLIVEEEEEGDDHDGHDHGSDGESDHEEEEGDHDGHDHGNEGESDHEEDKEEEGEDSHEGHDHGNGGEEGEGGDESDGSARLGLGLASVLAFLAALL